MCWAHGRLAPTAWADRLRSDRDCNCRVGHRGLHEESGTDDSSKQGGGENELASRSPTVISFVWELGLPLPAGTGGSENYTIGHVRELNRRGIRAQIVTVGAGLADGRDESPGIPFRSFRAVDDIAQLDGTVVFVTHSVFESVFLSSRILVMTKRPGRIFTEIAIDEPYPRQESFRTSANYAAYCRRVSETLHEAMAAEAAA